MKIKHPRKVIERIRFLKNNSKEDELWELEYEYVKELDAHYKEIANLKKKYLENVDRTISKYL